MVNMRERAELIRAALHLESAEGKGTRITLEVPLDMPDPTHSEPG
jgi:signal transduction histidine kinase